MANTPDAYLIEKSGYFLIIQILATIIACDLLFLVFTLIIIEVHNALGLDSTLTIFILFSFVLKLAIAMTAVLIELKKWLSVTYFVRGIQLVKRKDIMSQSADYFDLKYIRQISVQQSALGKMFKFGNLRVDLSSTDYKKQVTLFNINEPSKYAALFSNYQNNPK